MIIFDNVTKSFGSVNALAEVNLKINKGEFLFITGSSGSGKTTLLRLLTRELRADQGIVTVESKNLNKLRLSEIPRHRCTIGVVFQDFKLLHDLSVFENVALAMRVTDANRSEISRQVLKILHLVGLGEKAFLFPLQLAGGELQRACLARATVNHPQILLADEPTGNLDPATSWQIMQLLKSFHRKGMTILMATHNADIVNSMSERMVQLERGQIIKDEPNGTYEI